MTTITPDMVFFAIAPGNYPQTQGEIIYQLKLQQRLTRPDVDYRFVVRKRLDELLGAGRITRFAHSGPNRAHCYTRIEP